MSPARSQKILQVACVLALVALGLMVWSLVDPRPAPVVVAMSVGQGIGTLAFAAFAYVVLADLRSRLGGRFVRSEPPPPSAPSP